MRIVIDCNVFISAALGSKTCQKVIKEAVLNHEVCFSDAISREIAVTFEKVKLSKIHHKKQAILLTLDNLGIKVKPAPTAVALPDPDDAVYLQTALAARVSVIITGNKKHFPEAACGKIRVLSPREFLDYTAA